MNQTAIAARKAELRAEARARRDALSVAERARRSARIMTLARGLLSELAPSSVAGYLAIRSEANIRPLLEETRARARIALPVMSSGAIVFREWLRSDELVAGAFGTYAPPDTAPGLMPDVMLIPLVGFDRAGHRLGYGRGHYDRAIARVRAAGRLPRLIGVAFAVQEVAPIPAEPYDIALDAVVTEDEVLRF